MSTKTAARISTTLSVFVFILIALLMVIVEMIALNGASERQAFLAVGTSLLCYGAAAILLGVLAWKAAGVLISKVNLHPILAIALIVIVAFLLSALISFIALVLSIPAAGL